MKKQSISFRFCLLLLFALQHIFGLQIDENDVMDISEANKKLYFSTSYQKDGNMRIKNKTGVPIAIYSPNFPVTGDTPLDKAFDFIAQNLKLMKLDSIINYSSSGELDLSSSFRHLSTSQIHAVWTTVRLQQIHQDIPVHDSIMTITIGKDDLVTMVTMEVKTDIDVEIGAMKSLKQKADGISRDAVQKYGNGDANKIKFDKEPALTIYVDEELDKSYIAWCYKYYNKESLREMENCIDDETNLPIFENDISSSLKEMKSTSKVSSAKKSQNLRQRKTTNPEETMTSMTSIHDHSEEYLLTRRKSLPNMIRKLRDFEHLKSLKTGDLLHRSLIDIFDVVGIAPDRSLDEVCIPGLIQFFIDFIGLDVDDVIELPDTPTISDIDDIVNVPLFLENTTLVTTPQNTIDDVNILIEAIREALVQFLQNAFPCTEEPSLAPSVPPSSAPTTTNRPSNSPSIYPSQAPTTTHPPSNVPSITQIPTSLPSQTPTSFRVLGKVFNPDPLTTSGNLYGTNGYTDSWDSNSAALDSQTEVVSLNNILDMTSGWFVLKGKYAQIVDYESPFRGLFGQFSPNFLFNRQEDGFEAVNCYYHVDTFMSYMEEELEITIRPTEYTGGVKCDPSGFQGFDNSHYVQLDEVIAFGEGGVDDAEDADVIIHELGHLIHHWLTGHGKINQVHGLSEGFGDYLANSYARSLGILSPDDDQYHWVFKWDGHNEFWDGRRTDSGRTYPNNVNSSLYVAAAVWSSCNMKIYEAIGRIKSDKAHLLGLSATGESTGSEDVANAVVAAARNLQYSEEEISSMISIYSGCGYQIYA